MDKKIKDLETSAGVKVVILDELTGGDAMDIQAAIMGKSVEINTATKVASINPSEAYRRNLRVLCDFIVVSIGDETDNEKKWTALRSLPVSDWNMIQAELGEKTAGILGEAKK